MADQKEKCLLTKLDNVVKGLEYIMNFMFLDVFYAHQCCIYLIKNKMLK